MAAWRVQGAEFMFLRGELLSCLKIGDSGLRSRASRLEDRLGVQGLPLQCEWNLEQLGVGGSIG